MRRPVGCSDLLTYIILESESELKFINELYSSVDRSLDTAIDTTAHPIHVTGLAFCFSHSATLPFDSCRGPTIETGDSQTLIFAGR